MRLARKYRVNANNGDIPVWEFRCYDCQGTTLGALIMLPPGSTTIGALDEMHRKRHREYTHKKYGYTGERHAGSQYLASDRLDIRVKVIPGRRLGRPQRIATP